MRITYCGGAPRGRQCGTPPLPEIMLLARALKLGPLSEWPPCLQLCGLLPESVVARSGLAQGPGWKKRWRELNRISRHQIPDSEDEDLESGRQRDELALAGQQWAEEGNNPLEQFVHKLHGMFRTVLKAQMQRGEEQSLLFPIQARKVPWEEYPWYQLQPPTPRAQRTSLPAVGALSRDWKWSTDFLTAMVAWLQDLEWLPADDTLPQGHGHVSFMELALDFETHAGRPLPPTPQSTFTGTELSPKEKGRVMRLAVTLMGKAAGWESILPARITNHRRSLVPLGVGPVVGVKGRRLFTRPMAVWHHLKRLQKYNAERRTQQQQSRVAKQRQKRRRAQGQLANGQNDNTRPRERCPGKGAAKKAVRASASDFYAEPVLPEGAGRGVQYRVEEPSGEATTPAPGGGAVLFTPPQRCAVARRPET